MNQCRTFLTPRDRVWIATREIHFSAIESDDDKLAKMSRDLIMALCDFEAALGFLDARCSHFDEVGRA